MYSEPGTGRNVPADEKSEGKQPATVGMADRSREGQKVIEFTRAKHVLKSGAVSDIGFLSELREFYNNPSETSEDRLMEIEKDLERARTRGDLEEVRNLETRETQWKAIHEEARRYETFFRTGFKNVRDQEREISAEFSEILEDPSLGPVENIQKRIALRQAVVWPGLEARFDILEHAEKFAAYEAFIEEEEREKEQAQREAEIRELNERNPLVIKPESLAATMPQPTLVPEIPKESPPTGLFAKAKSFLGGLFGSKERSKDVVPAPVVKQEPVKKEAPKKETSRGWLPRWAPAFLAVFLHAGEAPRPAPDLVPQPETTTAVSDVDQPPVQSASETKKAETITLGSEIKNPWEAAQQILKDAAREAGLDVKATAKLTQNLKHIQDIDEALVRANNIAVPQWGIQGSVDHMRLPVGTKLDIKTAKALAQRIVGGT